MTFPAIRLRRSRARRFARELSRETRLSAADLILPAFVLEDPGAREPVDSMPGVERVGQDGLFELAERCLSLGVPAMALFPVVPAERKTDDAAEAWRENGLVQRSVHALKQRFPEKTLIPLSGAAICGNMKMNTLAKLAWSLDHGKHEIVLDEEVRSRAEQALRRMLDLSGGWRAPSAAEAALEEAGVRPSGCGCA